MAMMGKCDGSRGRVVANSIMVQHRAARYVCNHWHNTSSITGMLNQLEWIPLTMRRANTRFCMIYRVARTPVGHRADIRAAHHSGSQAWKYIPISTSYDDYKLSFLPRTIIASGNQLPYLFIYLFIAFIYPG